MCGKLKNYTETHIIIKFLFFEVCISEYFVIVGIRSVPEQVDVILTLTTTLRTDKAV
jgi:hypothetical protein